MGGSFRLLVGPTKRSRCVLCDWMALWIVLALNIYITYLFAPKSFLKIAFA